MPVTGVFREFWPYARGDRFRLVAGGLLSLVLLGCELAPVIIFEAIVSKVLEKHHLAGFWLLAGLWLGAAALGAAAMAGSSWLSGLAAQRISRERTASGSVTSTVEESLANQALIQAFNRQEMESRRLHREGVW